MKSVSKLHSIAVLGGTFDPIHIGHLRIAIHLREMGFDQVLMIPNHVPPHREQPLASGAERLAMLTLAINGLDGISASDIELKRSEPSYSATTVTELHQQWPEASLTWVMGNDAWNGFDRWYQPKSVLDHANILVISRPGEKARRDGWLGEITQLHAGSVDTLRENQNGKICHLHCPELDISASDLRQAIKRGDNIAFLTPEPVQKFIKQHQLYR